MYGYRLTLQSVQLIIDTGKVINISFKLDKGHQDPKRPYPLGIFGVIGARLALDWPRF